MSDKIITKCIEQPSMAGKAKIAIADSMYCRAPPHCTKNPIYVFPEMLVSNSYIHGSVRHLYIYIICLPIYLQQNRQTDPGNI
jgi:hypothetical protein